MRKQTWICAAILAWAALSGPARSAPVLPFPEISAALAAGNGIQALTLADTALGQAGLTAADRARLLVDRGFAHQLQADSQDALVDLTQAIESHSLANLQQSRAYLERGLILDSLNRVNDAIGDYGAALRLDPKSAAAYNNRANAYWRMNRLDDARNDYLASLGADSTAPEYPYYALGLIAEREGKPEEAKGFYTRAVAASPGYSLAANRLAMLAGAPPAAQAAVPPQSQNLPAQDGPAVARPAATGDRPAAPAQGIVTALPPLRSANPEDAPIVLRPPAAKSAVASPPPAIRPAGESAGQPAPRPAPDNSGFPQVQLGAWRGEAEAAEGWKQAVKKAVGALSGFSPHIVPVDLPGKGRYYRLRVETADGRQLCAILTAKGQDCALAPGNDRASPAKTRTPPRVVGGGR